MKSIIRPLFRMTCVAGLISALAAGPALAQVSQVSGSTAPAANAVSSTTATPAANAPATVTPSTPARSAVPLAPGVVRLPGTIGGPVGDSVVVDPTVGTRAPALPTPSASVPIRATPDTLGPDAADKLRTGPVGAAANRSSTTPTLPADDARLPLNCRSAGGRSIACPDAQ